jgi:hypothetical protein
MSNTIRLMPVSDLLGKPFFVPAYQRGYRWTRQQVNDLLEDIYSFAVKKNKTEKEFYCLQPIVVQFRADREQYEVVDGQQRLTTIRILLVYLQKEYLIGNSFEKRFRKKLFEIDYETRPGLSSFLDNIEDSTTNIEFFHVSKAYTYIREWFDQKLEDGETMFDDVCDSILKTLMYNKVNKKEEGLVQVIWYELAETDLKPIDTFIRINLGKISLNNAELIRALFLQERNFGEGDAAKLKQLEIAQQWDSIENHLQDENFWWFLNKERNKASSHIEYIFDMMQCKATRKDPKLSEKIGTDQYRTFRYFSHIFGNNPDYAVIKKNWDEVKTYFETFREWYENPKWYHYIGFLIYCGSSVNDILDLLLTKEIVTKEDATDALINEISKYFTTIDWKSDENNEYHIQLSFASDRELLRRFFLLFNLEYIALKSNQKNLLYKFPFKAFKNSGKKPDSAAWDIEHINAATENTLERRDDQVTWLNNALADIPDLDEVLKRKIATFLSTKNIEGFESLYEQVLHYSTEEELDAKTKNSIGNLTLLDAGTNRGYGNALFTTKRRKIIEKDLEGTFVPICTKNVFLKYYAPHSKSTWTPDDIIAYRNTLEKVMSIFLKPNPAKHEKATSH